MLVPRWLKDGWDRELDGHGMADVIELEDYRPKNVSGAVDVTFFGVAFENEEGERRQLTLKIHVEDGDYEGIIATVRDNGGWYVRNEGEPAWFMPWPCAAVRVEPAD